MVIIDLLILTLIHLLATALGIKILVKSKIFNGDLWVKVFLGMGIGLFVFAYFTFLIGVLGLLYRKIFIFIFLVLFIILRKDIYEIITKIHFNIKLPTIKTEQIILAGILLFTLFCNLCYNYVPPAGDDELRVHLALPKLYAKSHKIYHALPDAFTSHWVQTAEMLYTIDTVIRDSALARLHHYFFGLCVTLLVYFLTKSYISKNIALLACVIFYTMPSTTQLTGLGKIDLAFAFFGLLAIILFLKFIYESNYRLFYMSGFLSGISFATKYTGIFLILTIATIYILLKVKNQPIMQTIKNVLYFGLISCIPILPWLFRNYLLTDNPFYPFKIIPNLPYHEYIAIETQKVTAMPILTRILRLPFGLFLPGFDAGGPLMQLGPIGAAFTPLIIFTKFKKSIALFLSIGILNAFFMAMIMPGSFYGIYTYRYISNIIFCILSAYVIEQLIMFRPHLKKVIFSFLILGCLIPNISESGYFGLKRLPVFLGIKSKIEYLWNAYSKYCEPYELVEFVNKNISPSEKIFFICTEPNVFYYEPTVIAPQYSYLLRNDIENIIKELSNRNIRHIILNEKHYRYNPSDGSYTEPFINQKLGWLNKLNLKKYFTCIYRKDKWVIYRLNE